MARREDREFDRFKQEQAAIKDGIEGNRIEHLRGRVARYQEGQMRKVASDLRNNGIRSPKKPSKAKVWKQPHMRGFNETERLNLPARPLEYPGLLHTPRVKGPGYPLRKRNK